MTESRPPASDVTRWVPEGVDILVPRPAGVYDYALGGVHNFAVDRKLWDAVLRAYPAARPAAWAGRAFIGRSVRWLLDHGVRQVLDLGAGIPVVEAVHEIAGEAAPATRVVYVDIDPIAVDQTQRRVAGNPHAWAIHGDLRDPGDLLTKVAPLLDFGEPVAVLAGSILQFIGDADDPAALLDRIAADLTPGSYLVVSHAAPESTASGRAQQEAARRLFDQTPTPMVLRTAQEITALHGAAFEILAPGVVTADQWHPDPEDTMPCPPSLLAVISRRRTAAETMVHQARETPSSIAGPGCLGSSPPAQAGPRR